MRSPFVSLCDEGIRFWNGTGALSDASSDTERNHTAPSDTAEYPPSRSASTMRSCSFAVRNASVKVVQSVVP